VEKNTYKTNAPKQADSQPAERWQYPDVGHNSESKKGGVGILTAEKIELIQKQAFKQAYDEGYKKGFEKGQQDGKQSLAASKAILDKAYMLLQSPLNDLDQEMVNQLFELTISIARQLIRREIKTDPGEIVAVIREAIQLLPVATNRVSIALHPQDNALLKDLFKTMNGVDHWRLIDDISLQRGDCKISTEVSSIDATLETRLLSVTNKIWGGERENDDRGVTKGDSDSES